MPIRRRAELMIVSGEERGARRARGTKSAGHRRARGTKSAGHEERGARRAQDTEERGARRARGTKSAGHEERGARRPWGTKSAGHRRAQDRMPDLSGPKRPYTSRQHYRQFIEDYRHRRLDALTDAARQGKAPEE